MKNLDDQLLKAAKNGGTAACRNLLVQGANVHAVDKWGHNVLHLAAESGHTHACRLLLEYGAGVSVVDRGGWTALHLAANLGHVDTCQLLLERGAKITQTKSGWSALHYAARANNADIFLMLMEYGENHLVKTNKGQTALDLAIEYEQSDFIHAWRAWLSASAARAALQEIAADTSSKVVAP